MLLFTRSFIIRHMPSLIKFLPLFPLLFGIWSFYVEPNIISLTRLRWYLGEKSRHLSGLKLVHISDLHLNSTQSEKFLEKIIRKINELSPDILLFSGDFLCHATLHNEDRLKKFLNKFSPKMGAFCVLGNHDYAQYVSGNEKGMIDIIKPGVFRTFKRILASILNVFKANQSRKGTTEDAKKVGLNEKLCNLLKETPFRILNNETVTLPIGLNIVGLGELFLSQCRPDIAYRNYKPDFPGIVLVHNPDAIPDLSVYPGEWIFSGHTHGQQIYIPWPKFGKRLSEKLTGLENPEFCRGYIRVGNKQVYVTRGLGSTNRIRFNSTPEICLIECH